MIDARKHEFTVSVQSRGLEVFVDPTRLSQVISNLLTNAAKYTDVGGEIYLTAERSGGQILLRVRDSGMGISRELLPKLFDLFTQGERSIDRSEGGLGIGLTIARSLMEMHGGSIEAHSDGLGRGSTFVLRLPALQPVQRRAPSEASDGIAHGVTTGGRILVVEDNEDGANTIAMLLRALGQQVKVVFSGPAAVETAEEYQPNIVLLDIGLPGMSGFDVARRLRQMRSLDGVRLIALTGYGQDEDKQRAQEAGFDQFLVKPVGLDALRTLLTNSRPMNMAGR